ncbi:Ig-like domain-containing protein [Ekhidna sp.]|uniref:Ig-like domain-containing protein n=1 Tax=Ekhidna sp. TaxID=2608089 RepID=UPI003516E11E
MKQLLYIILFILFIDLSFQQCANPGRPTGGPKDTIPPTLLYANPTNGTTNFSSSTIELEFSEFINADKLKQQLIITPKTSITYKSIVKRNKLIIKLNNRLNDSTTYNFNFANGITDITEKNPAVNLSVAFSTGAFIDSLSVRGYVEELLTKEPGKGYVVGLYPFSDTLDYFTQNPMYFTTANDSGSFKINYIKTGKYKILAFNDDNKNLLLDPETESHGFLSTTIVLDSATKVEPIRCILQNVKPLSLINARPTGPYVEVKFNKQVDSYQLTPSNLSHNIVGENKDVIRIYKPTQINYKDSIQSFIKAYDSLGNIVDDTIKYVFIESNRKPATFSYSFDKQSLPLEDNPTIALTFNKPITFVDTSKLIFKSDTTFTYATKKSISFNYNRTKATIDFFLNADSIKAAFEKTRPKDSSATDTTSRLTNLRPKSNQNKSAISLFAEKGAFITVENDTSKTNSIQLQEPSVPKFGKIKLTLTTDHTHFTLQLINSKKKVAYSLQNQKTTILSVVPDTYKIRILIDDNKDGKWSFGNLLNNEEPEQVFLYPEETSVRENWEIDLGITF